MRFPDKYRAAVGDRALVTGAARGIGSAFSDHLAALGYNLILVGMDGDGLRKRAIDLETRHGVEVRTLSIDLSRPGAAHRLHGWCAEQGVEPVIVVNNAGIFSYNDIIKTDPAYIETIAGLHVTTVSQICRLFGADMARRGRGYLLNMSSYSVWMPWPGLALYSATKAYILSFSRALAAEMRGSGVSVTAVLPAGVATGLYGLSPRLQRLGCRFGVLSPPERTARKALRAMLRGRRQYIPGFCARLVLPVVCMLPACIVRFVRRKTIKYQK